MLKEQVRPEANEPSRKEEVNYVKRRAQISTICSAYSYLGNGMSLQRVAKIIMHVS